MNSLDDHALRPLASLTLTRRTFLVASGLAAGALGTLSLSACSSPSPEPNGTLRDLYLQAQADASAFDAAGQAEVSAMRAAHRDALGSEILRVCGKDSSGKSPDTCALADISASASASGETDSAEVDSGSAQDNADALAGGSPSTDALAARLADALTDTRAGITSGDDGIDRGLLVSIAASIAVIRNQTEFGGSGDTGDTGDGSDSRENTAASASDASGQTSADGSNGRDASATPSASASVSSPSDASAQPSVGKKSSSATALCDLLTVEYQVIYGLGLALSHASGAAQTAVAAATDKHRARRDEIIAWLEQQAGYGAQDVPVADAAYSFSTEPTDQASALGLSTDLELLSANACYAAAQRCAGDTTSALALIADIAQESAVDAAYFAGLSGAQPTADARFQFPGKN